MNSNNYMDCCELKLCLCCKMPNKLFLDLGLQPLANDYRMIDEKCDTYPLSLKYCPNCFHCQLSYAVDPDLLFKTYKYVSGTSNTGLAFFKENAKFINDYYNNHNGSNNFITKRVLDIACND